MASETSSSDGYAKLLDAWVPPEDAGNPIGCLATSFTFDSVFFEEECIGRFLRLESDPNEDGPIYLLEREERLAQLGFAAAIVDQHHCVGKRSLRWDLMPVRVRGGILHAKISLLQWSRCIRLIIGSANLTESGYRTNQEVFGVIDYTPNGKAPIKALEDIVEFLDDLVKTYAAPGPFLTERYSRFLAEVQVAVAGWDISDERSVRVGTVLIKPGFPSAFAQLELLWPGGSPPADAWVVSPFFDADSGFENHPAQELWGLMKKRGRAEVAFCVTTEDANDEDGSVFIHAPASLIQAQTGGRSNVSTEFYRVTPLESRHFHAKAIWLEGPRWLLYMVGSSNFTSHGLGVNAKNKTARANLEANLVYMVDQDRQKKLARFLHKTFPAVEKIDLEGPVKWQPILEDGEDAPGVETQILPAGFISAIFGLDEADKPWLEFTVENPPAGWKLIKEDDDSTFITEKNWQNEGSPKQYRVSWTANRPPSGFWVKWSDVSGQAWWPVNVESAQSLPPPEELKDLPLEVLINILTSARPLHRNFALKRFLMRRMEDGADEDSQKNLARDLDPHRRVDTSRFLLQRTRRVGWALSALRERLERPAFSQQSINWRLRGPVGVKAIAAAIMREACSGEERVFLIAELALELHRAKPTETVGSLSAKHVVKEIHKVTAELETEIDPSAEQQGAVERYVANVFRMVSQ